MNYIVITRHLGNFKVNENQVKVVEAIMGKPQTLKIQDGLVSGQDIIGIRTEKSVADYVRKSVGDWKCTEGFWHSAGEECGHNTEFPGASFSANPIALLNSAHRTERSTWYIKHIAENIERLNRGERWVYTDNEQNIISRLEAFDLMGLKYHEPVSVENVEQWKTVKEVFGG